MNAEERKELKAEEMALLSDLDKMGYHVEFQHFQKRYWDMWSRSYVTALRGLLEIAEQAEGLNPNLVRSARAITVAELYKKELWTVFKEACRKGTQSDTRPSFPPKIPALIGVGVCAAGDCFDRLRGRVCALERLVKMVTKETIHLSPIEGCISTRCCGKTPIELPQTDRITNYPKLVTCKNRFVHP